MSKYFNLAWVFTLLAILAVGGGTAVLPEMQHLTVDEFHWITKGQFRAMYSLGQVAPGPGTGQTGARNRPQPEQDVSRMLIDGRPAGSGTAGREIEFGFFKPSGCSRVAPTARAPFHAADT